MTKKSRILDKIGLLSVYPALTYLLCALIAKFVELTNIWDIIFGAEFLINIFFLLMPIVGMVAGIIGWRQKLSNKLLSGFIIVINLLILFLGLLATYAAHFAD